MLPNAEYASLYETVIDDDGDEWIAKLHEGKMTWILNRMSAFPTVDPDIMSVGDIAIGTDGKNYIVMMSNNKKRWTLHKPDTKKQNKNKDQSRNTNGYPLNCPSTMNIGDILVGTDGNEYIVKDIKGKKQYVIHQKVYKWSKSGVLYKTLNNTSDIDSGSCPRKMSKNRTKKPNNK